MIRRSTWILLIVFALLVGFTFFFQKYQVKKAESAVTPTPLITLNNLYTIDNMQVKEVKLTNSEGKQIDFYLDPASKKWAIKDVPAEQADAFKIESIMAQLFSLQVIERLTDTPPLDSVGLKTPAYTITITTTDGKSIVTLVGAKSAIGSGYYVRVDDGMVVLVGNDGIDNVINMLSEPPLLATVTPVTTPTGEGSPIGTPIGGTTTP